MGITGDANNYKPPTSYQYSLGVQQSLGAKSVLSVSYVGSQDRHENDYGELNLPPAANLPGLVAAGGAGINQIVPISRVRGIGCRMTKATLTTIRCRLTCTPTCDMTCTLQFGYTYSKAIDATTSNGSGGDLNNVTNPYEGWRYDFGPSQFDRTNVAFWNFVYQIPFLKNSDNHALRAVAGGWALSGIVTAESGAPDQSGSKR